jgi:AAHS family 3-hydroxyphenylpropionic acid transporter
VSVGRLGSAAGPLLAAALIGSGRTPQEVLIVLVPTILLSGLAVFILVSMMGSAGQRAEL